MHKAFLEVEGLLRSRAEPETIVVLIGGLSCTGKSTLSKQFRDWALFKGFRCTILHLDYWIVPVSERPICSTVFERYAINRFETDFAQLMRGHSVTLLPYNSATRELSKTNLELSLSPMPDLLIVEGIVSLAIDSLRVTAKYSIFVQIPHRARLRRLVRLYRDTKMMPPNVYRRILRDREKEEVPRILATRSLASAVVNPLSQPITYDF